MSYRTIRPVREPVSMYAKLEREIVVLLLKYIYVPVLKEIGEPERTLANAKESALIQAIKRGRVEYSGSHFTGKFNAAISKELGAMGAKWDKKAKAFHLFPSLLPPEVLSTILSTGARLVEKLKAIEARLTQILPEEIAGKLEVKAILDSTILKTDRELEKSLRSISVLPTLTPEARGRVAAEWQDNLRLYIKDFTAEETLKLRKRIEQSTLQGNRYESVIKEIQSSFGVTQGKAKFLARQETALLMTKFKEVRYTEAGIPEYKWSCVTGSKNHPVRPAHKRLDGKIFRWNDPPITTEPDQPTRRNNPGQDFNCRCTAIPIIRRQTE